jgi:hypothetical protein
VFGWARWAYKKAKGDEKEKKKRKKFEIEGRTYYTNDETMEFVNEKNQNDRIAYYVMGYEPEKRAEEKLKEVV